MTQVSGYAFAALLFLVTVRKSKGNIHTVIDTVIFIVVVVHSLSRD